MTFTVSGCLGLANENGSVFTIYPNPTTGLVNVNGLVAGDKIQVYTADGKLLFAAEATNSTITVDLNNFASGT
ncbi:MAG: T9SS type A sorting domain-containing protein [Crocinitomicaceae bacterium]|nr:T9SS type A sorting domain-containing protein [Crocinitomicaceae bacterium]